MSNYVYTCACCGTCWDSTSTGRKPTKAELARMVCQPCREAPKRIAALENMLNFNKFNWAFHEPSYAALCLSEQQISLGKFCEYIRNLRDGKDDRIIQGFMQSDNDRITEVEA